MKPLHNQRGSLLTCILVPQDLAAKGNPKDGKAIHVLSSGLKAAATWSRVDILQKCRECCGGQGFLAANKIGPMKTDMDVDVTFEGDNTVMMQQVWSSSLTAHCSGYRREARPGGDGGHVGAAMYEERGVTVQDLGLLLVLEPSCHDAAKHHKLPFSIRLTGLTFVISPVIGLLQDDLRGFVCSSI